MEDWMYVVIIVGIVAAVIVTRKVRGGPGLLGGKKKSDGTRSNFK